MKEFKLEPTVTIKKNKKSSRPKTRGFGYQVLGFGSGGCVGVVAIGVSVVTFTGDVRGLGRLTIGGFGTVRGGVFLGAEF